MIGRIRVLQKKYRIILMDLSNFIYKTYGNRSFFEIIRIFGRFGEVKKTPAVSGWRT